jgi:adenylate cyclase
VLLASAYKPLMIDVDLILSAEAVRISAWLLAEGLQIADLGQALKQLCERIVAAGVPLARATTSVQLLHANSDGVGREWRQGEEMVERLYAYGPNSEAEYRRSPFAAAHATGRWLDLWLPTTPDASYSIVPELKRDGFGHYLCVPVTFSTGRQRNGVTFASRAPDRFSEQHIEFFVAILPALQAVLEVRAANRMLDEVLHTYVGGDPRRRILAGDVHRGAVTRIRSAILFSDLRGFTGLTMRLSEEAIADLLNRYFDAIVPEIEARGGEVLKYIGDGILAIFQERDGADGPAAACDAALAAARAGLAALADENRIDSVAGHLKAGIALHHGEAAYGNVGSGLRLDFTVIGRDVNIANRLSRLNGPLAQPILMSEAFAACQTGPASAIGRHVLKGMDGDVALYVPG